MRKKRRVSDNDFIDLHKLRMLYGKQDTGVTRVNTTITMTKPTKEMINSIVPMGPGSFASAFIELSARFLACMIFETDNSRVIGPEIMEAISSPYMPTNLRVLANFIETRMKAKEAPAPPKEYPREYKRDNRGRFSRKY